MSTDPVQMNGTPLILSLETATLEVKQAESDVKTAQEMLEIQKLSDGRCHFAFTKQCHSPIVVGISSSGSSGAMSFSKTIA